MNRLHLWSSFCPEGSFLTASRVPNQNVPDLRIGVVAPGSTSFIDTKNVAANVIGRWSRRLALGLKITGVNLGWRCSSPLGERGHSRANGHSQEKNAKQHHADEKIKGHRRLRQQY
jgi:hypothetical protein